MTTESMEGLAEPARQLRQRFDELVTPHRESLWRYCLKLTGSPWDAEDLVQETLLRAFGRLSYYWQPVNPRAYLFRMASNAWIDAWRRLRPTEPLDGHDVPDVADPPPDIFATRDALRLVVRALPPRQRVVFLLTEAFGFSAADTAAMLGMSEGAVKAARYRARTSLAVQADAATDDMPAVARVDPVVERYVEVFNRRDVDALTALFAEDALNEIVGSADEVGTEAMRANSLAEWLAEPLAHHARIADVFGRTVVLVFEDDGQGEALVWIVEPFVEDGRVRRQRLYCFCPELLTAVAAELGVAVRTRGHWYGAH